MDRLLRQFHPRDIELERGLARKIRRHGYLTKADLKAAIEWKFHGDALRLNRGLRLANRNPPDRVRKATNVAFRDSKEDLDRVKALSRSTGGLHGVGGAVASVLLTFYDRDRFGVFDFHAWNELHRERRLREEEPPDYEPTTYIRYLTKLRAIARE